MGRSGLNSERNWRQAPHGPQKSPVKSADIAMAENVLTPWKIYENNIRILLKYNFITKHTKLKVSLDETKIWTKLDKNEKLDKLGKIKKCSRLKISQMIKNEKKKKNWKSEKKLDKID